MLPRPRDSQELPPEQAADPAEASIAPAPEAGKCLSSPAVSEKKTQLPAISEEFKAPNNEKSSPAGFGNAPQNKTVAQKEVHSPDQIDNKFKLSNKPPEARPSGTKQDDGGIENMLTPSRSSLVWAEYMKMVGEEDKNLLKDWAQAIDILLVFTGLFLAIASGLLLESSKTLQPDDDIVVAAPLKPSAPSIWVNCLWLLSIGLTISVSLFAMLAKEWCFQSRSKDWGPPYDRAIRRQKTWEALHKWKLGGLIKQMHAVMHVALMLFFAGLVLYLSEMHRTTAIITAVPIVITTLIYLALTIVPMCSQTFPLGTPLTGFLRWMRPRNDHLDQGRDYYLQERIRTRDLRASLFTTHFSNIFFLYKNRSHNRTPETSSPFPSESWVFPGCSHPVEKTSLYRLVDYNERQFAFRALMFILEKSNDKTRIEVVLDHIGRFPEVFLGALESSQALFMATFALAEHFQRLKNDPVACHDKRNVKFQAKCGRFMYLSSRPWLLYSATVVDEGKKRFIYNFYLSHYPLKSPKAIENEAQEIRSKNINAINCIPWLEEQAIKLVLECPLEYGGFPLCRELHNWVIKNLTAQSTAQESERESMHPTLWWMWLNLAIGAASEYNTFWPSSTNLESSATLPVALCDNVLTLSYFRHSDQRRKHSTWLKVVGLSGVLNIPNYHSWEGIQPDVPSNYEFYKEIIELLNEALESSCKSPIEDSPNRYIGKLPVYCQSEVRLYEFHSLRYCFDVLERACQYDRFAKLHGQMKVLKDMIPETRRVWGVPGVPEGPAEWTTQAPLVIYGISDYV